MKNKLKNWCKNHEKEIKCSVGGALAGLTAVGLGYLGYRKHVINGSIKTKVVANKNIDHIGLEFWQNAKIGNFKFDKYYVGWDKATAKEIGEAMIEAANNDIEDLKDLGWTKYKN
jgi:hypothetical protein